MEGTLEEIPQHFGIHFSPTLLLLVPFYAIFQSPYTLLLLQVLSLMIGAFPIFKIAKRRLSDPFPMILTTGYLLFPSLHWITTYDFHEIAFFIPLFLFAWNYLESNKLPVAAIFFALAAGTKEDAVLAVLFGGIAIAILNKSDKSIRNFGILLITASLIYFWAVTNIFMPAFGGGLLRLDRYAHLGGSVGEIAYNILANPLLVFKAIANAEKLSYIFWLFAPLAGMALFSFPGMLLLTPGLAENLLTNFSSQYSGNYQYDALLLPGLFISSILGISYILKNWPNKKGNLKKILISTIFLSYLLRSPVSPIYFPFEILEKNPIRDGYSKLVSNIPENASVSANTNLVPHISQRTKIYMLGSEPEAADIILADGADIFGFKNPEDFESYLNSYLESELYDLSFTEGRYIKIIRKDLLK